MTAFTTLTAGENALSHAMANEFILAINERSQAIGGLTSGPGVAGTSAQSKWIWIFMQQWLESNCTNFVDHVSGPLNSGSTAFLYFTLATWRSAAGLDESGFRRSTDGVNFSYGNIQAGDVWGKWIFEDLQKGFAALKWLPFFRDIVNVRGIFPGVTGNVSYYGYGSGPSFWVWYPYFGTRLGGNGTYTITLDARHLAGSSDAWYISLGRSGAEWEMSGDGGGIILDTGRDSGVVHFASSLTFYDDASLVEIYGCRLTASDGAASVAASFTASSVSVSANLNQNLEGVACFEFFPVIKVPFTNS